MHHAKRSAVPMDLVQICCQRLVWIHMYHGTISESASWTRGLLHPFSAHLALDMMPPNTWHRYV